MPSENGRRVSQQSLADRIGVHVITVSQWERGRATPTVANLMAIADSTGKPMEFFTGDDDEEDSEQRMRILLAHLIERHQDDLAQDLLLEIRLMKARRAERMA
jgi:transcriptional regulator with XRE-family HTH domain